MKCLLINPWIADFAAYNFWVRPLGLYRLAQWLEARAAEFYILDCLSPFKAPGKFTRQPVEFPLKTGFGIDRSFARYGISVEEFRRRLAEAGDFDCVIITSVMSYWYPGIQWVIEEIKDISPNVPVILGGIYATLWPEHAGRACNVDLVCKGPIEACSQNLSDFLGLGREPERREKAWHLLDGIYDNVDYWAVRTAVGCPFSCSYCASGVVSGPFSPFPPEKIMEEILFLYERGIKQIAFYDDALLVDFKDRLTPIFEGLIKRDIHIAFHTPNGLHASIIDRKVADVLARSGFRSIRLSLETTNPKRQADTGGKVTSRDIKRAVENLISAGMPRSSIGVYLLVGLPGQDLDEIEEGVTYVKSLGVRPYLAEFSPIPGTREWTRLEKQGVVSPGMDPLLTNNTLFFRLFSGYDMGRFQQIKRFAR